MKVSIHQYLRHHKPLEGQKNCITLKAVIFLAVALAIICLVSTWEYKTLAMLGGENK
jgi:hypothetical protein